MEAETNMLLLWGKVLLFLWGRDQNPSIFMRQKPKSFHFMRQKPKSFQFYEAETKSFHFYEAETKIPIFLWGRDQNPSMLWGRDQNLFIFMRQMLRFFFIFMRQRPKSFHFYEAESKILSWYFMWQKPKGIWSYHSYVKLDTMYCFLSIEKSISFLFSNGREGLVQGLSQPLVVFGRPNTLLSIMIQLSALLVNV